MKKVFKKWNSDLLGWTLALALLGFAVSVGFDGPATKLAVVDTAAVAEQSDAGKAVSASLETERLKRLDLVKFMDQNRVIAADEYQQLRDLSLKADPSDADKAALAALKAKIVANVKKFNDLQTQTTLSADDRNVLQDFSARAQQTTASLQGLFDQLNQDLQQMLADKRQVLMEKVKATAKEVAKAQGCTVVFDTAVAPYGDTDLTDATLQALNAKK